MGAGTWLGPGSFLPPLHPCPSFVHHHPHQPHPADEQAQYNNEKLICGGLAFHSVRSISWLQKGEMNLVRRLKRLFLGVPGVFLAAVQNHAVLAGESGFKSLIFEKNLINISSLI